MKNPLKTLSTLVALALAGVIAHAQSAPMMVHYQGRLTQPNGLPLTTPTASVAFEIFPSASGGTRLWPPAGPLSTYTVILRNGGIFSVMLGDTSILGMPALTQSVFQQGVAYLQVSIAGNPVGPRQPIVSVPWSILSQQANTVADGAITTPKLADDAVTTAKLASGAVTATKLANDPTSLLRVSGGALVSDGTHLAMGSLGIDPAFMLTLSGSSNNLPYPGIEIRNTGGIAPLILEGRSSSGISAYIDFYNTATNKAWEIGIGQEDLIFHNPSGDKLYLKQNGRVGIGTPNPQSLLDVSGDVFAYGRVRIEATTPVLDFKRDTAGFNVRVSNDADGRLSFADTSGRPEAGLRVGSLELSGSNSYLSFTDGQGSTGSFQIGQGSPILHLFGTALRLEKTPDSLFALGECYKPGGGSWATLSDARLKSHIAPLKGALASLLRLRGVNFEYKHPEAIHERAGVQRGFVAQDVEREFPDWVVTTQSGYKALSLPIGFNALTVEAFREQQRQIEALRKENERLRRQNAGFEARLRALESKAAR